MNAQEARDGLAERAQRARNLRAAYEAALIDRDAFALAVDSEGALMSYEIGAFLSESTNHDYQRTRFATIRNEWPERIRKVRVRHPDIVITQY